ncbi:carcinoembryonic antigen-related cell adhesion molecule 6-like [Crotalus tigris]|uniref:carcinoembryonic antigen-related cell adhesion molecule 6-like n=1 Tax=Crotalus tigris TaxID=88082 RepID=UPI00192F79DF|nr:carcinoembryonic antigen-related cell adhesion molecule 6-like [Crotalus tigris]
MEDVCSIHGGKSSWWMVLWTATIFHLARTEETIRIVIEPQNPTAGSDVWFNPPTVPNHIVFCSWYRQSSPPERMREIGTRYRLPTEGTSRGASYSGREDIHPNCSLSIHKVTRFDSVKYQLREGAPGVLYVGDARLTVSDSTR